MSQIQASDNPKVLIVLGPPRSFTTVVSTILGQHPELYGLPETHIFGDSTVREWWQRAALAQYPMTHGLLRATAQIIFGEQTEETVTRASGWLQRRSDCTTGYLLELFCQQLGALTLVEKSPSTVHSPDALRRAYEMFPRAKFMHLLRHPRGYGESVVKALRAAQEHGGAPKWLLKLATYPSPFGGGQLEYDFDPQKSWYALNMNINSFLQLVPKEQKLRIHGEQILTEPDRMLAQVCAWLGVRRDAEAIEEMKHPERSPYACFGPANARFGNDHFFLADPVLRPARAATHSLDGPLGWRDDEQEFVPQVKELAAEFGYA
ncbi:MAG TPA: sulfotransferase [Pyrinomonadaceae bacterium]|jgi:hypothetical protein|nr:sulfotransferase [Pyrinomonadaceae bacterium]